MSTSDKEITQGGMKPDKPKTTGRAKPPRQPRRKTNKQVKQAIKVYWERGRND